MSESPRYIGRYEILEELGHGAMGTVYRAKDPAMDRVVAIKTILALVLSGHQSEEFRERFYREARAAGRLAHPGIVAVFDVGEHEGLPFLVMEFVEGPTLEGSVKRGERLALERVCELGQQIAEALGYAHRNGVVHRDIKPANILLTSREIHGIERPKITDFGIAKLSAGQITISGQMLGTPAFMPPEQFTGAPTDGRADLFSLGVILYWMATGEQPFPGETMTSVSYKVVHTEPVPPRKLNPAISAALESVILKCLAKSPAERVQSGEELAKLLAAVRTGTAANLSAAAPQSSPGFDSDATLVDVRSTSAASPATVSSPVSAALPASLPTTIPATLPAPLPAAQTTVSAPVAPTRATEQKSGMPYLVVAGSLLLVIVLGGWYFMRGRGQENPNGNLSENRGVAAATPASPAAQAAAPSSTGGSPPAAPLATQAATKLATTAAPIPVSPARPVAPAATKSAALAPPASDAATARKAAAAAAAAVDFAPKSLDPKENSKLTIDAEQMPLGVDFTVEMNGKTYFRRSVEGNKEKYEDFFVPPGIQEFQVSSRKGAVQKTSNIVSAEFKAKKRKTLKVELRIQGDAEGKGVPQDLYPNTQVVVTLK